MNSKELALSIAKFLDSKKATDLEVIQIGELTTIGDYFVVATASNTTLVKSLCEDLDEYLGRQGIEPKRIEGRSSAQWILMDYRDVIVHIFYAETRKIPVQYAKKIVGNKQYGGARQYIPLKVNAANVMPIIFAQAIMFIPITLVGFSNVNDASGFVRALTDHTSFWYNLIFAVLIILFTYFYTAITINPTQMSDDLKRNNGFIPGIKPGKQTAEYIDVIMSRITLPGSFFLALVAIMPAFAGIFGVKAEFAQFFGGTSLLILVGVVLDTLQQVESHLLMRHYDGLLKSGRIKGRSGNVAAY